MASKKKPDFETLVDVPGYRIPGSNLDSGARKRVDNLGDNAPIFEDRVSVIPQREWDDIYQDYKPSLRPCVKKIKNQKREGSCTANAGTGAYETIAVQQYGEANWIEMSAISLYKRCGRSPSSGSSVGCNLKELRDRGALPTHAEKDKLEKLGLDPGHTMPETGFYTRFPSGWEETAKHFRIVEYFDVGSIEGFFSALLQGFTLHYGRRGHSIYAVAAIKRGGKWYAEYANSWAPSWGDNGFGYDTLSGLRDSIGRYGAYAYRDVTLPLLKAPGQ